MWRLVVEYFRGIKIILAKQKGIKNIVGLYFSFTWLSKSIFDKILNLLLLEKQTLNEIWNLIVNHIKFLYFRLNFETKIM